MFLTYKDLLNLQLSLGLFQREKELDLIKIQPEKDLHLTFILRSINSPIMKML